jgi:hypothetical protein
MTALFCTQKAPPGGVIQCLNGSAALHAKSASPRAFLTPKKCIELTLANLQCQRYFASKTRTQAPAAAKARKANFSNTKT